MSNTVPARFSTTEPTAPTSGGSADRGVNRVETVQELLHTPCFSWCDHSHYSDLSVHESDHITMSLPDGALASNANAPVAAMLCVDDSGSNAATARIHLWHGEDDMAFLLPDEAEVYADRLITFAGQVRRLAREGRERRRLCSVFSWCTEVGEHDTHTSRDLSLTRPDDSGAYLGAYLLAEESEGNRVSVGFEAGDWVSLDAAGLRREIDRIRAHCDQLARLADMVADEELAAGGAA
ncbi:hypothetical protein FNQ90_05245 [Streptomyces alkaliphilus]|uniref:Uncharacterized protein n=1 Tax=Streptomyces alkaliphilus TaxID=1472722 RepID=A0A7W3TB63_9ACTN|nr:hypothetical protein [Streptomyces alkaliphilus]MBB0243527.1 hypothetical protein [Streptomyces alkaliphilus]